MYMGKREYNRVSSLKRGSFWAGLICSAMFFAAMFEEIGDRCPVSFLLGVIAGVVGFSMAYELLGLIVKGVIPQLQRHVQALAVYILIAYGISEVLTTKYTGQLEIDILAIIGSAIICFFTYEVKKNILGCIKGKYTSVRCISAVFVVAVPFVMLVILLKGKLGNKEYINNYADIMDINMQVEEIPDNIAKNGPDRLYYDVNEIYYGDGGLTSKKVDMSGYVSAYTGVNKKVHDISAGERLDEIELSGVIYYPKGQKKCPAIFFVHGQHVRSDRSYLGYDYLGRYLAARGYVFVSVDENSLNVGFFDEIEDENDARAVLMLNNIEQVLEYTKDEQNELYEVIDKNNICVGGHSRGGEAAAIAAIFNSVGEYPDKSEIRFDYGFDIRSVVAVAPTSNQYMPGGRPAVLKDTSYLLIQGMNDQDVEDYQGWTTYKNIVFSGEKDCFKAAIYILGANHGQFNELWGEYDKCWPYRLGLATGSFLEEQQQQTILKYLMDTFLECTLREKTDRMDVFTDIYNSKYAGYYPETLYIQNYSDSKETMLCDFDEKNDTNKANDIEVRSHTVNMSECKENIYRSPQGKKLGNTAMYLNWEKESKLIMNMNKLDLSGRKLKADICNTSLKANEPDIYVELRDKYGNKSKAKLKNVCCQKLYPALEIQQSKVEVILGEWEKRQHFVTVNIDLEKIKGVDISKIVEVNLIFCGAGSIYIDDIALTCQQD